MDISATDSAEPVTAEELDEVLKGLTSFGDIDYRLALTRGGIYWLCPRMDCRVEGSAIEHDLAAVQFT